MTEPRINHVIFCQRVENRADDHTLTYVGVINDVTLIPEREPYYARIEGVLVVSAIVPDGSAYLFNAEFVAPDGRLSSYGKIEIQNRSGTRVSATEQPLTVTIDQTGTYWFRIFYQGALLHETPLVVGRLSTPFGPLQSAIH